MTANRDANANTFQGDFGEMWLEAVAASCGVSHMNAGKLDLEKADVLLTLLGEETGTYNPSVKVQVKTTHDLSQIDDDTLTFDLDVQTYDVLRRTNHATRRILVVFEVGPEGDRTRLLPDGTLLVGRGAWVSLEEQPETTNTTTLAVKLPVANTIDETGLRRMLETYGVPRSTVVPDVQAWDTGA